MPGHLRCHRLAEKAGCEGPHALKLGWGGGSHKIAFGLEDLSKSHAKLVSTNTTQLGCDLLSFCPRDVVMSTIVHPRMNRGCGTE